MKTSPFIATMLLFLLLTLASCSSDEAASSTSPSSNALADDNAARDELAARAGAPLFDGMGGHQHEITTSDPDAISTRV